MIETLPRHARIINVLSERLPEPNVADCNYYDENAERFVPCPKHTPVTYARELAQHRADR